MNKRKFGLIAVLAILACARVAFAMGGEYGKGDPQHPQWSPQWPAGVKELVNREDRVGGFWINGFDTYYFAGGTESFNDFLQQYSKLHDTPLTLFIHPGKAPTAGIGDQKIAPSDWEVGVVNNRWTKEFVEKKIVPQTECTVTVNVYLGGQVDLENLKVPANVEVKSGGEIENFVAQHGAK